jgi:hypothetical protein
MSISPTVVIPQSHLPYALVAHPALWRWSAMVLTFKGIVEGFPFTITSLFIPKLYA